MHLCVWLCVSAHTSNSVATEGSYVHADALQIEVHAPWKDGVASYEGKLSRSSSVSPLAPGDVSWHL